MWGKYNIQKMLKVIWNLKPNKDSQNVFDLEGMVAFLGLVSFIKKELSKKEGLKLSTE